MIHWTSVYASPFSFFFKQIDLTGSGTSWQLSINFQRISVASADLQIVMNSFCSDCLWPLLSRFGCLHFGFIMLDNQFYSIVFPFFNLLILTVMLLKNPQILLITPLLCVQPKLRFTPFYSCVSSFNSLWVSLWVSFWTTLFYFCHAYLLTQNS